MTKRRKTSHVQDSPPPLEPNSTTVSPNTSAPTESELELEEELQSHYVEGGLGVLDLAHLKATSKDTDVSLVDLANQVLKDYDESDFLIESAFVADPLNPIKTFSATVHVPNTQVQSSSSASYTSSSILATYQLKVTTLTDELSVASVYYNGSHYLLGFRKSNAESSNKDITYEHMAFANNLIYALLGHPVDATPAEIKHLNNIIQSAITNDAHWQNAQLAMRMLENPDESLRVRKKQLADTLIQVYDQGNQKTRSHSSSSPRNGL